MLILLRHERASQLPTTRAQTTVYRGVGRGTVTQKGHGICLKARRLHTAAPRLAPSSTASLTLPLLTTLSLTHSLTAPVTGLTSAVRSLRSLALPQFGYLVRYGIRTVRTLVPDRRPPGT